MMSQFRMNRIPLLSPFSSQLLQVDKFCSSYWRGCSPLLDLLFPAQDFGDVGLRGIHILGGLCPGMTEDRLHLVDRSTQVDQPLRVPVAEGMGGQEPLGGIIAGTHRQIHDQGPDRARAEPRAIPAGAPPVGFCTQGFLMGWGAGAAMLDENPRGNVVPFLAFQNQQRVRLDRVGKIIPSRAPWCCESPVPSCRSGALIQKNH